MSYRTFMIWDLYGGVIDAFREKGIPCYQPRVHPTATIEKRAEQLRDYINESVGPDEPVHLIAHSMGGLDARYLASPNGMNQGNRILSITTLGTPHRGACIADVFTPPLRTFVSLLAWASHYATLDDESRVFLSEIADNNWGALKQLSPRYLEEEFNPKIIDHPDVVYFSYAGCLNKQLRSLFDLPRRCPQYFINPREGENDGMVSVRSAQWGIYKGKLPAEHGEMIGLQIFPWRKNSFDHVQFHLSLIPDLEKVERGEYRLKNTA
ncbi:MAG: esterase/lipase family protein [bacterium]